jgi:hypothetical protein
MHLHFEQLMADYERRLVETLRGFSLEAEFLETWVPSEDPTDSALDLVEHARLHGLPSIEITFDASPVSTIDFDRLLAGVAQHGRASLKTEDGRSVLSVGFNGGAEEGFEEINPIYRSQLQSLAKDLFHQGVMPSAAPAELVSTSNVDGVRLSALVNSTSGVIRVMRHEGGKTRAEMTALDRLCHRRRVAHTGIGRSRRSPARAGTARR